jgi:aconitate hydratase
VKLTDELQPWVSAKDVILELLKKLTVKGGVGKVFEYFGPGVKTLSVPERATITNMGAELGATTSIFPSDNKTLEYLKMQGRERDWKELRTDSTRDFEEVIELDLSAIEPNVAKPHMPDQVCKVSELSRQKVNQVIVGSCTNSSYSDLMIVALALKGKKVHSDISFCVLPGSKQVYETIARNGALAELITAGARILESACGPCIGMGVAPGSAGVTVRTFNRNFKGRCGTADASAYLVSPETAAAIAINGVFTDPRKLGEKPKIPKPKPIIDDSMILKPPADGSKIEIIRGPNIRPLPELNAVEDRMEKEVLLKVGNNITTDTIMPAGAKVLPLRSNIPAISEFVYVAIDKEFPKRAREKNGGFIVGGENYGQGSSREHAAIAPLYLGVKVVIAKNFARIHKANLVNWGIVPLEFENAADYEKVAQGDIVVFENLRQGITNGKVKVQNKTTGTEFNALCTMGDKSKEVLLAGGNIMYIKKI